MIFCNNFQFWVNLDQKFLTSFQNLETFQKVTILSEDIRKPLTKKNMKEIRNLINNGTFLVEDPEKGEPVNPFMDVYKAKIQSDGSIDKLKLIIVVIGNLQNKVLIGDNSSPKYSMRTLK